MNFLINATLKQLMGWAESEVNQNGNRIKAAIYGLILAALTKVSVAVFHAQIPAEYLPQAQQLADWVANATLAGAGAVVAAWTARPAGSLQRLWRLWRPLLPRKAKGQSRYSKGLPGPLLSFE